MPFILCILFDIPLPPAIRHSVTEILMLRDTPLEAYATFRTVLKSNPRLAEAAGRHNNLCFATTTNYALYYGGSEHGSHVIPEDSGWKMIGSQEELCPTWDARCPAGRRALLDMRINVYDRTGRRVRDPTSIPAVTLFVSEVRHASCLMLLFSHAWHSVLTQMSSILIVYPFILRSRPSGTVSPALFAKWLSRFEGDVEEDTEPLRRAGKPS
jgi:hypothetical protein